MTDLARAIAAGDGAAAMEALGRLASEVTGARLVTVMVFDPSDGSAGREWSSMPGAYPVSGRKPINPTRWSDQVFGSRESFVANTIEEIAEVFPDHELIRSLGCESVLNLPVIIAGQVIGTINCLDAAGYWTDARLADAEALRLPGAAALMFHSLIAKESRE
ncbi:MAG: GAF domain-containing protein [Rubellimicrobium sp.]|nr:GAF domain-containing protein [Rubellimicrobium sp.]